MLQLQMYSLHRCLGAGRLRTSRLYPITAVTNSLLSPGGMTKLHPVIEDAQPRVAPSSTLIQLDDDPWGRPYRWANRKTNESVEPIAESIDSDLLNSILKPLFP